MVVIGVGFIGSRVAAAALERRIPVLALTRSTPLEPTLGESGVRIIIGDAADPDVAARVLSERAHVVYCAGGLLPAGSVEDPASDAVGTLRPLINGPGARVTYLSSGGTVY